MEKKDLAGYVLYRRSVVIYECPYASASAVLEAIVSDTRYRSHCCRFISRWPADDIKPMVQIEAEFTA